MDNKYVGARYVPLFQGEWDIEKTYESLVVVTNCGNSYTSMKETPAGTDITNENYWICTGNFNSQLESYKYELERMYNKTETFSRVSVKDYGAKGDGIKDDSDAINRCIAESKNKVVYLPKGTYYISKPIVIPGSCYTIMGAGKMDTIIVKNNNVGGTGKYKNNNIVYDFTGGYVIGGNPVTDNNNFSNITLCDFSIKTTGENNGIMLPCISYSNIDNIRIDKAKKSIVCGGWCNVLNNLQLFDSYDSVSFTCDNSPISTFNNVQSNRGCFCVNNSNVVITGCAFDNGNPCYRFINSKATLNGCDCETYNYAIDSDASQLCIAGGRFEHHYSNGANVPTQCCVFTNNSLVSLNSPYIEYFENHSGVTTKLNLVETNSIVTGTLSSNVEIPYKCNSGGYIDVNGVCKSLNAFVKNREPIKDTTNFTITVPVNYREPRTIDIDFIATSYDKCWRICGTALLMSNGQIPSVITNNIAVTGNSTSNSPFVELKAGTNCVYVNVTIPTAQKTYGWIEY